MQHLLWLMDIENSSRPITLHEMSTQGAGQIWCATQSQLNNLLSLKTNGPKPGSDWCSGNFSCVEMFWSLWSWPQIPESGLHHEYLGCGGCWQQCFLPSSGSWRHRGPGGTQLIYGSALGVTTAVVWWSESGWLHCGCAASWEPSSAFAVEEHLMMVMMVRRQRLNTQDQAGVELQWSIYRHILTQQQDRASADIRGVTVDKSMVCKKKAKAEQNSISVRWYCTVAAVLDHTMHISSKSLFSNHTNMRKGRAVNWDISWNVINYSLCDLYLSHQSDSMENLVSLFISVWFYGLHVRREPVEDLIQRHGALLWNFNTLILVNCA